MKMITPKYNVGDILYFVSGWQISKMEITGLGIISDNIIRYLSEERTIIKYGVEEEHLCKTFKEAKQQALKNLEKFYQQVKGEIILSKEKEEKTK